MPNQEHVQAIIEAGQRLADESPTGRAKGDAVVEAAGVPTENAQAYWAFREAEKRGGLVMHSWQGSMRGPYEVSRP